MIRNRQQWSSLLFKEAVKEPHRDAVPIHRKNNCNISRKQNKEYLEHRLAKTEKIAPVLTSN
jgi:hypothetical protein